MANHRWLQKQLSDKTWLDVVEQSENVLRVQCGDRHYLIYAAGPGDYLVTVDTVQRAEEQGADTVVYGSAWCRVSAEAATYGKQRGILVLSYAELFRRLERR